MCIVICSIENMWLSWHCGRKVFLSTLSEKSYSEFVNCELLFTFATVILITTIKKKFQL